MSKVWGNPERHSKAWGTPIEDLVGRVDWMGVKVTVRDIVYSPCNSRAREHYELPGYKYTFYCINGDPSVYPHFSIEFDVNDMNRVTRAHFSLFRGCSYWWDKQTGRLSASQKGLSAYKRPIHSETLRLFLVETNLVPSTFAFPNAL